MEMYSKNEKYSQEEVSKLISVYHMALEAGDNMVLQDAQTKIYYFIEKFVYKTLWDSYGTLMRNPYHREDIIQEVWLRIFNELKHYNPEKGAITTFIAPWIRHVVSDYASSNFKKTSVYYANAMQKINGAQNYCRQHGLDPDDIEMIMNFTGLSERTIKNAMDIMSKQGNVSYEVLIDAGVDYTASIKNPEESFIDDESEHQLKDLLQDILTEEEIELLKLLINPENGDRKHASYREISEHFPGSNIPKIKRRISRITTKIKKNKKFAKMYPYIIEQEKILENAYISVMNADDYKKQDDDDIDDHIFDMGDDDNCSGGENL